MGPMMHHETNTRRRQQEDDGRSGVVDMERPSSSKMPEEMNGLGFRTNSGKMMAKRAAMADRLVLLYQ